MTARGSKTSGSLARGVLLMDAETSPQKVSRSDTSCRLCSSYVVCAGFVYRCYLQFPEEDSGDERSGPARGRRESCLCDVDTRWIRLREPPAAVIQSNTPSNGVPGKLRDIYRFVRRPGRKNRHTVPPFSQISQYTLNDDPEDAVQTTQESLGDEASRCHRVSRIF
ncbi:hypothetical protein F2P81_015601 [Scophthalmus maximus]|uniref:Uncharacterized protein n=1 Tax=Scophthalmus maximus TaxID=52904 RepID=A0A6A4S759_SCOMX|nr:hypothetical protein F2P81_015601 [Scophthalmus maximus]